MHPSTHKIKGREQALAAARALIAAHDISARELKATSEQVERNWLAQRRSAVAVARAIMRSAGITVADLQEERADQVDADSPSRSPEDQSPATPKYLHPRTGQAWDGEGSQPDWLKRALTTEGYRVAELRPQALEG